MKRVVKASTYIDNEAMDKFIEKTQKMCKRLGLNLAVSYQEELDRVYCMVYDFVTVDGRNIVIKYASRLVPNSQYEARLEDEYNKFVRSISDGIRHYAPLEFEIADLTMLSDNTPVFEPEIPASPYWDFDIPDVDIYIITQYKPTIAALKRAKAAGVSEVVLAK